MSFRFSIRQRILLTFLGVTLAGGLLPMIVAGSRLENATIEFSQHDLETEALTAGAALLEPMEHFMEDGATSSLTYALSNLQRNVSHDYVLLDSNRRVLAFTPGLDYDTFEHIDETPELRGARSGAVSSNIRPDTRGEVQLNVAAPIQYQEGEILGYIALSTPMEPIYTEAHRRWLEMIVAVLPVLALVVVASLWIGQTILRPIKDLHASALRIADGALDSRITVQSTDEIGELGRAFNYMAERLTALLVTQRAFVSNAAHELRTPLMNFKLRIEALQGDTLSEEQRTTYLHELNDEVDHLSKMVSSLLLLARVDEGRHTPELTPYDGAMLMQDIARHWRIQSQHKGLYFSAEIPTDLPDLPIPSNDLRVVLDNLLSNAVKYTSTGSVRLAVTVDGSAARFQVSDTGTGFPPEHRARLFERFYRANTVRVRQAEGTGLGLSIVEAILSQYGGTVAAESDGEDQGATFTVRLPLKSKI